MLHCSIAPRIDPADPILLPITSSGPRGHVGRPHAIVVGVIERS